MDVYNCKIRNTMLNKIFRVNLIVKNDKKVIIQTDPLSDKVNYNWFNHE